MDFTLRRPRVVALIAAGLVCAGVVTGCTGTRSPWTVCPAGRDIRDLEISASTASSTETITAVNNLASMMDEGRPPEEIQADWDTVNTFLKDANVELQALGDPTDQVAFEEVWDPLAQEFDSSDGNVGAAVDAMVVYTDEQCSATATPTDGAS